MLFSIMFLIFRNIFHYCSSICLHEYNTRMHFVTQKINIFISHDYRPKTTDTKFIQGVSSPMHYGSLALRLEGSEINHYLDKHNTTRDIVGLLVRILVTEWRKCCRIWGNLSLLLLFFSFTNWRVEERQFAI